MFWIKKMSTCCSIRSLRNGDKGSCAKSNKWCVPNPILSKSFLTLHILHNLHRTIRCANQIQPGIILNHVVKAIIMYTTLLVQPISGFELHLCKKMWVIGLCISMFLFVYCRVVVRILLAVKVVRKSLIPI